LCSGKHEKRRRSVAIAARIWERFAALTIVAIAAGTREAVARNAARILTTEGTEYIEKEEVVEFMFGIVLNKIYNYRRM
jgi:hypothetical protein